MAQFGRPIQDTLFSLLGGHPINTSGNRYQNLDESIASTSDYVYSQNNPGGGSSTEHLLTPLSDPLVGTGHILRVGTFQIDEDSGSHPRPVDTSGTSVSVSIELRQGITSIFTISPSVGAAQIHTKNLTVTEADSITDYSDLRVYISFSGGGGSPTNRRAGVCYFVELEIPDAPGSSRRIFNIT